MMSPILTRKRLIEVMTPFQTKTGLTVAVRHITEADAPHFVDIFKHMGPDSRYRRFHTPMNNPSDSLIWREAERIAHADPQQNDGLIAFTQMRDGRKRAIAAARYISLAPGEVEVAMSVRDDFQGQGVGTLLLQLLTEEAHQAGLQKMVGTIMNSNEAMWVVMERLPFPVTRRVAGAESVVEIDLTQRKPAA